MITKQKNFYNHHVYYKTNFCQLQRAMASTGYSLTLILVGLLLILAMSMSYDSSDYREWQEFKEFRKFEAWKKAMKVHEAHPQRWEDYPSEVGDHHYRELQNSRRKSKYRDEGPPPIDQVALMARYIVNQAGK